MFICDIIIVRVFLFTFRENFNKSGKKLNMENSDEEEFPLTEDQMEKLAQLQVFFLLALKTTPFPSPSNVKYFLPSLRREAKNFNSNLYRVELGKYGTNYPCIPP
jgi:hypothetical protein